MIQLLQSKIDDKMRSRFQYEQLKQITDQLDTHMNPQALERV